MDQVIIVGSGPGGCAAALELVSKGVRVLMLEAGEDHDTDEAIDNPELAGELEENYFNQYFWSILQTPQANVILNGANYSNGRLLGGGSAVNGMQCCKGSREVFAEWELLTKDPAWSPDNVHKEFVELQKWVNVRKPQRALAVADKCVRALELAMPEFPRVADYNAPDGDFGPFTNWQYWQQPDGSRESASTSLIKRHLRQSGRFQLVQKATVMELLFSPLGAATGVRYLVGAKVHEAFTRLAVVLAAGIQTPLLLERAGIGDGPTLRRCGIPLRVHSPANGTKLVNHLIVSTIFSRNKEDPVDDHLANLYTFGAFYPSESHHLGKRKSEWIGIDAGEHLVVALLQTDPRSVGAVHVQSDDTNTVPLACENALGDVRDLDELKVLIRERLLPFAAKLEEIDPAYRLTSPDPDQVDDDAYLERFIQSNLDHAHHWQSQCPMGLSLADGVVDPNGEVFGVQRLYVSDACIIPSTVDCNTAASAFIIGKIIGAKLADKLTRRQ
jgi:choline dehydrogenase